MKMNARIRQYSGLTGSRPEKVANFRLRILNIDLYDYAQKVGNFLMSSI